MLNHEASSKGILVLGMHRSGTSALTRVLNLMGADISGNLMSPASGNEKGFWESVEAYEIHERLLSDLGHSWFDVGPMPDGWLSTACAARAARDLTNLLLKDFSASRLWVIKDPRMCRLMPLWRQVVCELGIELLPVLVVRHPLEVAASLYKMVGEHHGMPEGLAYSKLLWTQYLLDAERDTRGLRRSMVTYSQLMSDWKITVERIGADIGVQWPISGDAVAAEVRNFLSESQRHHRVAAESDERDLALKLYEVCSDHAAGGALWESIGRLRRPIDDGMEVVGRGMGEWASSLSARLSEASSAATRLAGEVTERDVELYESRLQLLQRDAELSGLQSSLAEQVALLAERNEALYGERLRTLQKETELQQVQSSLEQEAALVADRSKELYECRLQLQKHEAELAIARCTVVEQGIKVVELKDQNEALALQVEESALHRKTFEGQLEEQRVELSLLSSEVARVNQLFNELARNVTSRRWLVREFFARRR
jgi:hypothetical protein